jgi:ribosomal protein S18 acetylase RimI-like enzyme
VSGAREHAIAWRHGYHARVCDRIEPWAHGSVALATDMPTFYDYNLARVEGEDPGLTAEALAAVAEPLLASLGHRRIELEDEEAGARVRDGFAAMGWVAERLAFLHRDLPGPAVAAPAGAELSVEGFAASRPLRVAWQSESIWGDTPEFALVEEEVARRRGTRAAIARAGGEPVGFAAFSATGAAVEIELVFVLPERRDGGLGGALVTHALATAASEGAREAFIEADDVGSAKRLYERLGFRTVWRRHSFTKVLSAR